MHNFRSPKFDANAFLPESSFRRKLPWILPRNDPYSRLNTRERITLVTCPLIYTKNRNVPPLFARFLPTYKVWRASVLHLAINWMWRHTNFLFHSTSFRRYLFPQQGRGGDIVCGRLTFQNGGAGIRLSARTVKTTLATSSHYCKHFSVKK